MAFSRNLYFLNRQRSPYFEAALPPGAKPDLVTAENFGSKKQGPRRAVSSRLVLHLQSIRLSNSETVALYWECNDRIWVVGVSPTPSTSSAIWKLYKAHRIFTLSKHQLLLPLNPAGPVAFYRLDQRISTSTVQEGRVSIKALLQLGLGCLQFHFGGRLGLLPSTLLACFSAIFENKFNCSRTPGHKESILAASPLNSSSRFWTLLKASRTLLEYPDSSNSRDWLSNGVPNIKYLAAWRSDRIDTTSRRSFLPCFWCVQNDDWDMVESKETTGPTWQEDLYALWNSEL